MIKSTLTGHLILRESIFRLKEEKRNIFKVRLERISISILIESTDQFFLDSTCTIDRNDIIQETKSCAAITRNFFLIFCFTFQYLACIHSLQNQKSVIQLNYPRVYYPSPRFINRSKSITSYRTWTLRLSKPRLIQFVRRIGIGPQDYVHA